MKTDLENRLIANAQMWAMQAKMHRETVLEIYQLLGIHKADYNGSKPVAQKLSAILNVLYETAEVFSELDQAEFEPTDCDHYHGEPGSCPVNYDGAQGAVDGLIQALEAPTEPPKI